MPDPHLRVDHRNQTLNLAIAAFRTFDFKATSKMQHLDVMHPSEQDLIVGPLPLHDNIKLVVAGTLERPYLAGRQVLDDFERVYTMNFGKSRPCYRNSAHGRHPLPVVCSQAH